MLAPHAHLRFPIFGETGGAGRPRSLAGPGEVVADVLTDVWNECLALQAAEKTAGVKARFVIGLTGCSKFCVFGTQLLHV